MDDFQFSALLKSAEIYRNNHKFQPLDDINLFSILSMENKEVSAHSAFLYYILKPFESENNEIDDKNLKIFLNEIGVFCDNASCLEIQREVWTNYGRLDYLITVDENQYVVELKIWAGEQPDQINRYQRYLKDAGFSSKNIFYLTPDTRQSCTGISNNITLKKHVKNALQSIIDLRKNKKDYCLIIQQYIKIIDKLTGADRFMATEDYILKSANDIIAVNTLVCQQREILTNIMREFFIVLQKELQNGLEYKGFKTTLSIYEYGKEAIENYYTGKNRTWPALVFKIESKLACDYELYFFVEIENNLYIGISPRNRVENGLEIVSTKGDKYKNLKGKRVTDVFLDWDYVKLDSKYIDFSLKNIASENSFIRQLLISGTTKLNPDKVHGIAEFIKFKYGELCSAVFKLNN